MVHAFKFAGADAPAYFVWDIESGSLHNVDYGAFLCIKKRFALEMSEGEVSDFSEIPESTVKEILDEIEVMVEEGVLDAKTPHEVETYKKEADHIKAMCLHICHDCNLRCEYCFAKDGTYNTPHEYMSLDVGKAAIDLLIKESKNIKNLEVDFFGGEPLLNLDTVKCIVEYAKVKAEECGKKFSFTMTTNCLLLDDETVRYLNEEMDNVVLSIDGRQEIHDAVRHTVNGRSAYSVILGNALKMRKARGDKRYYVRGTFTAKNLDFSKDIIALADAGFDQISVEPVVLPDSSPLALKKEHFAKLFEEYDELVREMLKRRKEGRGFNFFHYMIDLEHGPCLHKRLHGCGAGLDYVAVSPWGDIYPCHQFVGIDGFLLGNVYDGIKRQDIRDKFAENSLLKKSHCSECPSKYYCGGGCAANAYNFTGDIGGQYEPGCVLSRKRLENSLALEALSRVEY